MTPWLLRYLRCPKRALQFSLFSLIKLHLASHPLASSYSRVTVSSVFCAQNIFLGAQGPSVWGAVKHTKLQRKHENKKQKQQK